MPKTEQLSLPNNQQKEFGGQMYQIERFLKGDLSAEQKLRLAQELTPLTGKGFLRFDINSPYLEQDVINHVVEAPRLTIVRNARNEAVAFIASATFTSKTTGYTCYDLGGIIVEPSLHGVKESSSSRVSMAEYLLRKELRATKPDVLVLRTQSIKMYNLAAKVAVLDLDITRKIAAEEYPTNLDGIVNRRVYRKELGGYCLYDDVAKFAKDAIQIEGFDWLHGDALVVAGFVKPNLD